MKCTVIDSLGRNQMAYIINESGLYALILSPKLPQAREFNIGRPARCCHRFVRRAK